MILGWINEKILGIAVPVMLMMGGVYFLFYLRGYPLRKPMRMIGSMLRKQKGQGISPLRAMMLALAGTLGVGNIVGVASALALGGAGAVFWMWISAFCAMMMKYAEILLAIRHRRFDGEGKPHGSAMQYMTDYMSRIGLSKLGKGIGVIFALLFLLNAFSMGSALQSNAVAGAASGVLGISPLWCGVLLAILTCLVILRGTEGMARFTEIMVPMMSVGFALLSVIALSLRYDEIGEAMESIFQNAFSFQSASGGMLGFLLSRALRYGTMRGLVSNEGGCGTSPTAHASSNTPSAAEQGFWGVFEVFADTIVLCTVTALVLLVSDAKAIERQNPVMLTIRAYESILGHWAAYFLVIAIFCFGFATAVCWAHYGMEAAGWLFRGKWVRTCYITAYGTAILVGSFLSDGLVWELADIAIGGMTVMNVFFLFEMRQEIREETLSYFSKKENKKIQKKC